MKGKIAKIKFFHSIKAATNTNGKSELSYFDKQLAPNFNITIDDNLLKIHNVETNEVAYSSLTNVIYFTMEDGK